MVLAKPPSLFNTQPIIFVPRKKSPSFLTIIPPKLESAISPTTWDCATPTNLKNMTASAGFHTLEQTSSLSVSQDGYPLKMWRCGWMKSNISVRAFRGCSLELGLI
ncbi:uncharacterized protein N7446_007891 [Penicillium canescens]|uniref:Uncharacterized protein n=1 Tax=Penicillium canescens TaxID=5083 RepID=A0AAD6IM84_PENCN|nr:uncharacterized protein N7446_007891 [Penicillium canescens]KAJ6033817.1 hypothetical protein N7444_011588 [Penicillium canescens]KAJ6056992.1 hypothetical protein N7460_000266 [Penicillium canescens]KAJ6058308.1 hypothetical protein N7446_007891 [Penicillium canescens]